MKICIFGAGAIGGYLAAKLALAGNEVCAIARGAHLQAMQRDGLLLREAGAERIVRFPVSDDPAEFGPQDVVICALKAHQAAASAASMLPLLRRDTPIVTAMNGIPWWYFYKAGGAFDGSLLPTVDPGARQWMLLGPERAIGCVVDPACEVVAPGIIEHHELTRFTLGEPDGSNSARVTAIAEALVQAGLEAPVRAAIRWNIWLKLWGNVCFSPISLLTGATLDRMASEPGLRALCVAMMQEARAVAEAHGIAIPAEMIERRMAAAGAIIGHKMSMLQDLERGRSLEIDALVRVVPELGRLVGVATPTIDTLLTLVGERGHQAGLYEMPATPPIRPAASNAFTAGRKPALPS
ncbi:2-dehydropantoate 2-reductase [Acidocella sp.]|jgi:2-dehydropantoate 2-reductase|uniref:2-dehydropantoate 2-reductase n=1 Tax=Acidocella sp. TaxID=50710 RepID=UPI002F41D907